MRHSFRFLKKKDSSITSHIFVGLLLHGNPLHVVRTLPKMDPSMHPIGRSSVDVVELFLFISRSPSRETKRWSERSCRCTAASSPAPPNWGGGAAGILGLWCARALGRNGITRFRTCTRLQLIFASMLWSKTYHIEHPHGPYRRAHRESVKMLVPYSSKERVSSRASWLETRPRCCLLHRRRPPHGHLSYRCPLHHHYLPFATAAGRSGTTGLLRLDKGSRCVNNSNEIKIYRNRSANVTSNDKNDMAERRVFSTSV